MNNQPEIIQASSLDQPECCCCTENASIKLDDDTWWCEFCYVMTPTPESADIARALWVLFRKLEKKIDVLDTSY